MFNFLNPNGYYETPNDILLLGTGNPPWDNSAVPQCGSIAMDALLIRQGATPFPLDNCYGGCTVNTGGLTPKCYLQDQSNANLNCPSQSIWRNAYRDCIPCPMGCAACSFIDANEDVTCSSCFQNFTSVNTSGICGCVGSYYFNIDPSTKQGACIMKQRISPTIMNISESNLIFDISASPNSFYTSLGQVNAILPLLKVYGQGILLNSGTNYNLTSNTLNNISITLDPNAAIPKNGTLVVDFSEYNQIEGIPIMIVPSNVTYTFLVPYYYLDPKRTKLTPVLVSTLP